MKLSIMLPSYKEADNLKKILPEIHSQVKKLNIDYDIFVIDSMEELDDTKKICNDNQVTYISRENGNTYGDAIRTGIDKANGNYLIIMDADGSHEPKSILDLYNKITSEDFDLVIGSRYVKGGKTENNIILILMSWVLNITYRIIFSLKVKDCSDSFRIYKLDKLKSLSLVCDNFDIVEEILIKLYKKYPKIKVSEVPINFKKRDKGISKRDLVKFIFSYFGTIKKLLVVSK